MKNKKVKDFCATCQTESTGVAACEMADCSNSTCTACAHDVTFPGEGSVFVCKDCAKAVKPKNTMDPIGKRMRMQHKEKVSLKKSFNNLLKKTAISMALLSRVVGSCPTDFKEIGAGAFEKTIAGIDMGMIAATPCSESAAVSYTHLTLPTIYSV